MPIYNRRREGQFSTLVQLARVKWWSLWDEAKKSKQKSEEVLVTNIYSILKKTV